ncbi:MAG: DoxX family protein [Bacteroidota bacterium]
MKTYKIVYWVSTGLLTALMLMSAGMYLFNNPSVQEAFTSLGFPTFIIYPLAAAKILGLVALWTNYNKSLKEWAYAGFTYNTLLATGAHLAANDGQFGGAAVGFILVMVSYFSWKKIS